MQRINHRLTLLILAVFVAGCASRQPTDSVASNDSAASTARTSNDCCATTFDIPANNRPTSYFPTGVFLPDESREKALVEWYSRSLQEMAEPSFKSIVSANVESYRFLWLRSFNPGVVVRVWKCSREYCMTAKQLDSIDKFVGRKFVPTAKLAINNSRSLSVDEWNSFLAVLDRSQFWSTPTVDGKEMADDGAEWVLEGAKGSQYHVVARQSPTNGDYYHACLFLLKLSALKIDVSNGELY
jgi:hypothetical protein